MPTATAIPTHRPSERSYCFHLSFWSRRRNLLPVFRTVSSPPLLFVNKPRPSPFSRPLPPQPQLPTLFFTFRHHPLLISALPFFRSHQERPPTSTSLHFTSPQPPASTLPSPIYTLPSRCLSVALDRPSQTLIKTSILPQGSSQALLTLRKSYRATAFRFALQHDLTGERLINRIFPAQQQGTLACSHAKLTH